MRVGQGKEMGRQAYLFNKNKKKERDGGGEAEEWREEKKVTYSDALHEFPIGRAMKPPDHISP